MMLKNNKWKFLISSAVILLPILFGVAYWNELPTQMTTHWGANGAADGFSSRAFAVFALPLILLAVHWFCLLITAKDPRNKDQNQKVFGVIFWIIPVLSLMVNGITYAVSLGKEFQPFYILTLLMGVFFVCIGNYFPKCKQNHTIGIRVKWALESEENWNATHRLGGKVWVAGGLALIGCILLPEAFIPWASVFIFAVIAIVPVAYSWGYHQKQVREGTAVITPVRKGKSSVLAAIICIAALALCGVLLFTGNINVTFDENAFTIEADYWRDLTVEYSAIESIEYRENDSVGSRTNGLGGGRLLAGAFQNSEFGHYTRYTYTGCDACVVFTGGGQVLVINGPDIDATKAIYDMLKSKIE